MKPAKRKVCRDTAISRGAGTGAIHGNISGGLTAEHRVLTYKKGVPVYEWRIKDAAHKRNEALDVRNYATAALEISNVTLKKPDKAAAAPQQQRTRRRRSSGGVI